MPQPRRPAARAEFGLPANGPHLPLRPVALQGAPGHGCAARRHARGRSARRAGVLPGAGAAVDAAGLATGCSACLRSARHPGPRAGQVPAAHERAHFRRALALSDVVLDTVHWSGGNTSLDAFAAATPVVALTGRFMRGRQTAAMLGDGARRAGGREPGGLRAHRRRHRARPGAQRALREAIARGRPALFDRREPIAALEEALLAAAAKT